MIDGLSESSRALLDAARQGLAPDAAAIGRVRAKVAATGGLLAGVGAKLLVLAVLAGIGGVVLATRGHGEGSAPTVSVPEPAAVEVVQATATIARVDPPPPAPAAAQRRVAPVLVVVERHADLAREVALIDAAMTALRTDPGQALATIQIYDTETAGHGQLAEDAAAIAIEARCALHEPGAQARLAGFDARWPTSAQRARLTEACP